MADHCTVFGALPDQGEAFEALRSAISDQTLTVQGELPNWTNIVVAAADGMVFDGSALIAPDGRVLLDSAPPQ